MLGPCWLLPAGVEAIGDGNLVVPLQPTTDGKSAAGTERSAITAATTSAARCQQHASFLFDPSPAVIMLPYIELEQSPFACCELQASNCLHCIPVHVTPSATLIIAHRCRARCCLTEWHHDRYGKRFYLNGRTLSNGAEHAAARNTHTRTLSFASSYAASAPIATSRSLHWLLCSAMPVHLCTAMATASTRCVPMNAASRHVLWLPAE